MSTAYIIYPSGNTLYSKASLTVSPWGSDAVNLTDLGNNLYSGDSANKYLFLGTAATATSTDESVGQFGDLFYGTPQGGDVFMTRRVHSWDWTNATLAEKVRAITNASQLVDKFNFIGHKVESDQFLQFPRQRTKSDGTIITIHNGQIPTPIIEAVYLIAEALLSGRNPEADFEGLITKVETFGPIRTEYERGRGPQEHLANLIPSPDAWQRIKPFLEINTGFDLNRG